MIDPLRTLWTPLLTGGALLMCPLTSHGLARILGGDFFVNLQAGVEYDSNVDSSNTGEADFAFLIGPGFQYVRPDTRAELTVEGFLQVQEFIENEAEDAVNWGLEGSAQLPLVGSPLTGQLTAGVSQQTASDSQVNERLETFRIDILGELSYQFRPKIAFTSSAGFEFEDPDTFSQNTEYTWRNELVLTEIIGQIGGFAGVELERQTTEGTTASGELTNNNIAFLFGLNGQLVPEGLFSKLELDIGFGFRTVNNSTGNGSDETIFVVDGSAVWQARVRTQVGVQASRDIDLAPDDTSSVETNVNLFVIQEVGNRTIVRVEVGYEQDDFVNIDRTDDAFYAEGQVEFQANERWSITGGYTYENRDSDLATSEFDRHFATASTVYRF
ncbi:MAG: outer membrane beta-barrel protein [Opitutales bacterium]